MLVVEVKCPRCGCLQNSKTLRRIKCTECGFRYSVYPAKKLSRITRIVEGSEGELFRVRYHMLPQKLRM